MGDGAPAPGHRRAASAAREPVGSMAGIRPSGNASSSSVRRNALRSMRSRPRTGPGCSLPPRPYSVRRRKPPETRGDAESGGRSDCCVSNWPSAWLGCVKPRSAWLLERLGEVASHLRCVLSRCMGFIPKKRERPSASEWVERRCPCRPADLRALPETVGEERAEGGRSVRKNVGGVVPRVTIRAAGRVFRCEIHTGRILTQARSGWCRMQPIKAHQIGNVGQEALAVLGHVRVGDRGRGTKSATLFEQYVRHGEPETRANADLDDYHLVAVSIEQFPLRCAPNFWQLSVLSRGIPKMAIPDRRARRLR